MKKVLVLILLFILLKSGFGQVSPASFNYKVTKLEEKMYEVSIIVKIRSPWHIYSQFTPEDGPSLPTSIKFGKNPLVEVIGKTAEKGNLIVKHDDILDTDLKYFSDKVEFVQQVRLKEPVKTNLSGSVFYMVCTDKQCLKPATVNFTVDLD